MSGISGKSSRRATGWQGSHEFLLFPNMVLCYCPFLVDRAAEFVLIDVDAEGEMEVGVVRRGNRGARRQWLIGGLKSAAIR